MIYLIIFPTANVPSVEPIRQNNPWRAPSGPGMIQSSPIYEAPSQSTPERLTREKRLSDAEFWLNSTTSSITSEPSHFENSQQHMMNGTGINGSSHSSMYASPPHSTTLPPQNVTPQPIHPALLPGPLTGGVLPPPPATTHLLPVSRPHHSRSQSVDSTDSWLSGSQRAPTLAVLAHHRNVTQLQSQQNGTSSSVWTSLQSPPRPLPDADPFDAAWAAKASTQSANKAFEVKL